MTQREMNLQFDFKIFQEGTNQTGGSAVYSRTQNKTSHRKLKIVNLPNQQRCQIGNSTKVSTVVMGALLLFKYYIS